jgi:hypothetical protein
MRSVEGASLRRSTRGAWLLALAGVPCSPFVPGEVAIDGRPESGGPTLEGEALLVPVVELVPDDDGPVPDDALVVGAEEAPLLAEDLETVLAAAVAEVRRLALERAWVAVDGHRHAVGTEAQANWLALLQADSIAVARGRASKFPKAFLDLDGKVVTLATRAAAEDLFDALFDGGNALHAARITAELQLEAATTTEQVVTVLVAYAASK